MKAGKVDQRHAKMLCQPGQNGIERGAIGEQRMNDEEVWPGPERAPVSVPPARFSVASAWVFWPENSSLAAA